MMPQSAIDTPCPQCSAPAGTHCGQHETGKEWARWDHAARLMAWEPEDVA